MQGKKKVLTPQEEAWFKKHFKHTKNEVVMSKLGVSMSSLHRLARLYGLKKTKQFMSKMQAAAMEAAAVAIQNETPEQKERRRQIAIQNSKKGCFKKGEYRLGKLSPERLAEIRKKQHETWRKSRENDIARCHLGLERKAKFRLPKDFNPKRQKQLISIRYGLRKKGYSIPKQGGMAVYITADTIRSEKIEINAKKLGIVFRENV